MAAVELESAPSGPSLLPPPEPRIRDRALWALLLLVLVLVAVLIGAGVLFVTLRDPTLIAPVEAATGGVTLLAVLIALALTLARRQ